MLGIGPRKRKYEYCGQFGHIKSNCKESVDQEFSEDEQTAPSFGASTARYSPYPLHIFL
jgi:hypothetical protein